MTRASKRYRAAVDLFSELCELEPAAREAALAEACGDDAELQRDVRALLEAAEDPSNPLDEDLIARGRARLEEELSPALEDDWCPDTIGPYRVHRRIGRGGMGVVYEAEQERPRRRVAIKLLHPGLAHGAHLKRFRLEVEVLGRLQHPGIARIYEAGTFDLGQGEQPYLAMELIDGTGLVVHAEAAQLERDARLALVARICDAVQYAHDQGVLHRDLKPDNVLVDERGQPKVLDFGVASVSDTGPELSTIHTAHGDLVGTVTHMAPEQIAGRPDAIGPATDVYALGVIAFQLLTGRLPHEVSGLPVTAAVRLVCESDAPRLGTIDRGLRGDVETVVSKALESDPGERYVSAAAFAADLRRLVGNRPIAARRPSALYRARKYVRRHRGLVAGLALAVLSLVGGTAVSVGQARRASNGERLANARALDADRQAYRVTLGAVSAALDEGRHQVARAALEDAPESQRSWEAEHFEAVVAQAFGRLLWERPTADVRVSDDGASVFATCLADDRPELVRFSLPDGTLRERYPLDARPLTLPRDALALGLSAVFARHEEGVELDVVDEEGARLGHFRACSWAPVPGLDAMHQSPIGVAPTGALAVLRRLETLVVCDTSTGQVVGSLPLLGLEQLADDGSRFLVVTMQQAHVFDTPSASRVWSSPAGSDGCASGGLSPDGRFVYTAGLSSDPMLRRWSVESGEVLAERPLEGCRSAEPLALSGDGTLLAIAPGMVEVRLFDAGLERELGQLALPAGSHLRLALDSDGGTVAAAQGDLGLRVWERTAPGARAALSGHGRYVYCAAFSPDGARIASGSWDRSLRTWDVREQRPLAVHGETTDSWWNDVVWAPDAGSLYAAGPAGVVRLEPETGAALASRELEAGGGLSLEVVPGSGELLVGAERGVLLLEPETLEALRTLPGIGPATRSPDGRRVATCSKAAEVQVVDAQNLAELWSTRVEAQLEGLAWSPDGGRLAFATRSGFEIRDARDGELELRVESPGQDFSSLAWTPDGERLVVGEFRGEIGFWSTETGERVATLAGHRGYVKQLRFSPDGRTLASASGDGDVRLWLAAPHDVRAPSPRSPSSRE